jgi:hypothetical protein
MCSVAELGAFGVSSLTEFTLKVHPVPASVASLELFNKELLPSAHHFFILILAEFII